MKIIDNFTNLIVLPFLVIPSFKCVCKRKSNKGKMYRFLNQPCPNWQYLMLYCCLTLTGCHDVQSGYNTF